MSMSDAVKEAHFYEEKLNLSMKRRVASTSLSGKQCPFSRVGEGWGARSCYHVYLIDKNQSFS